MPQKSSSIGSAGSRNRFASPVSLGITMGSNEYPSGTLTLGNVQQGGAYWYNASGTTAHTEKFYLCDVTGNTKVELFSITLQPGHSSYTNTASISATAGKALKGKALYLMATNSSYPGYSYIGLANYTAITLDYAYDSFGITVNAGTGGTASASTTSASPGTTVTITSSPSSGYSANTPTASGISFTSAGTNRWTFTMPSSAVTVSCTFSKISYNVTTSAGTGGSASSNRSTAQIGDTVTITCTPSAGYSANTPTASGISFASAGNNKWTFTMPAAAVSVSCTFSKITYSISKTVNPAGGGTVTLGQTTGQVGNQITISQTPATGYYFNGWTFSPSGPTVSGGKFTMPANNVTVTANYLKRSTASVNTSTMTGGSNITLTIIPDKTSYSHKYRLSFGTNMQTSLTAVAAGTTSVTINVPESWSNYIPSAASKSGGTMLVETYNGTTKIGEYTISGLTYNVPATAVPTVGTITTSVIRTIGGTTYANVGNIYVQSKCGVRTQASASGALSSSISQIEVSISGYTTNAYKTTVSSASVDFTSGLLTVSGTSTITVKATDSRGRTATRTATITVNAYNRPSGTLTVYRVDSGGTTDPLGTYAMYALTKAYTAVGSNSLTWSLTSQNATENSPAASGNVLPSSRQSFSQTSEYTISLTLTDAFETVTIQAILPTAQFMIFVNADGDRIALMKATNDELSKNGKSGTIELSANHQIYIGNMTLEDYIRGVINGTI